MAFCSGHLGEAGGRCDRRSDRVTRLAEREREGRGRGAGPCQWWARAGTQRLRAGAWLVRLGLRRSHGTPKSTVQSHPPPPLPCCRHTPSSLAPGEAHRPCLVSVLLAKIPSGRFATQGSPIIWLHLDDTLLMLG